MEYNCLVPVRLLCLVNSQLRLLKNQTEERFILKLEFYSPAVASKSTHGSLTPSISYERRTPNNGNINHKLWVVNDIKQQENIRVVSQYNF
jgi:hypothetical protein